MRTQPDINILVILDSVVLSTQTPPRGLRSQHKDAEHVVTEHVVTEHVAGLLMFTTDPIL